VNVSYRHSLFFSEQQEADTALLIVDELVDPFDSFIDEDMDGITTYEVRFLTEEPLAAFTQRLLARQTQPGTYAFNCQE
jgi:hypothetical protein